MSKTLIEKMDTNANEWSLDGIIRRIYETIRQNSILNIFTRIVLLLIQFWISTWTILWLSVFTYVVFYNMYMPSILSTKDVYIQYDSTCDMKSTPNSCATPYARIALTQGRSPEFVRGQTYRFTIEMNLPESEVNWSQGLFMVRLKLFDQKRNEALNVAKPTGLKYKSYALRGINLLLYWPLYILGMSDETQTITIDLIEEYVEGSLHRVGPTTEAIIEFEARDVQIYPPTILRISATLTGLRYYMYHWSKISFFVGTSTLSFFLYVITLIGFTKWYQTNDNNNRNDDKNEDNNEDNEEIDDNNEMAEELKHLFNIKSHEIEEQIEEELNQELNDETVSQSEQMDDFGESGLTGDLSANESEASSTVVIPEAEDNDRQSYDIQQICDSSMS